MAQIATTPIVLKDVLLVIGTDNYETAVSEVVFTPTSSQVSWQGLTPASTFVDQTTPTWTCKLTYAQDWVTANSLAQYLLANAGAQKTLVFKPQGSAAGKPIITATVIIAPGPIGGAVNTVQVGTVTLGVVGTPAKTANP